MGEHSSLGLTRAATDVTRQDTLVNGSSVRLNILLLTYAHRPNYTCTNSNNYHLGFGTIYTIKRGNGLQVYCTADLRRVKLELS